MSKGLLLQCTKNFVVGDQLIIMAGDQIEIIEQIWDDKYEKTYFTAEVVASHFSLGFEQDFTPQQIADYFGYITSPTIKK